MEFKELDLPEYKGIPIYPIGDGTPSSSPIVIYKYSSGERALSPLHRHSVIQINYIARGGVEHQINRSSHKLVSGDLFVIPPYIPHRLLKKEEDCEVVELEFQPEYVFGGTPDNRQSAEEIQSIFDFSYIEPFFISERSVPPRLNLSGPSQMQAAFLIDDMLKEYREKTAGYQLALKADLCRLLVIASRAFPKKLENREERQLFDRHREAVTCSIHYTEEHFTELLTIEDAAKMALLSQSYFSYLFKTITGKTFVEYLHALRVNAAKELLKTTDAQVIDICLKTGFRSVNHFNRIFKEMCGVSPRQYRQAHRTGKGAVQELQKTSRKK